MHPLGRRLFASWERPRLSDLPRWWQGISLGRNRAFSWPAQLVPSIASFLRRATLSNIVPELKSRKNVHFCTELARIAQRVECNLPSPPTLIQVESGTAAN